MEKPLSGVVERFLRYVKIDTQSVHNTPAVPSTEKQKDLARLLVKELKELGVADAAMDEHTGCVYASIPANCETDAPAVGFIAHMDTTPDAPGTNVNPRIVWDYDGKDIVLNPEKGIVMKTSIYEHMLQYVGQDLIVTDGTTLLGSDDKAGVAEVMNMVEYLLAHPEAKHGPLKIGFTTDEEVGKGAKSFDIARFGADFAYTVDGQTVGEITSETFNAADALVHVHGVGIHPGRAKNKMINAIKVAMQFDSMIPEAEIPAHSDGREGYYHITDFQGEVTKAFMKYLIRDFDREKFEQRKAYLRRIEAYLNGVYGEGTVELEIVDSYYSMYEVIRPLPEILDHARKAIAEQGVTPRECALRGGTDGSVLSNRGLPCPNISTGYQNGHCIYEYVSIQALETSAQILIRLAQSFA